MPERKPKILHNKKKKGALETLVTPEDVMRRCLLRCQTQHLDDSGEIKYGHTGRYQRCVEICIEAAGKIHPR